MQMRTLQLAAATLAAAVVHSAFAGEAETLGSLKATPRFKRIGLEEGLPQLSAYSIVQDPQGFMWIATGDGLARYDGYEFKKFVFDPASKNTISNNGVTALFDDGEQYLWIGTGEGGLNRYEHATETFTHYRHDPQDPLSLSSDNITSIARDKRGRLWIGTTAGLDRLDPATGKFTIYRYDAGDPRTIGADGVLSIHEGPSGMWVGTTGGLSRYSADTDGFVRYRHDADNPRSISNDTVSAVYQDSSGIVWAGTDGGGLNALDPRSGEFKVYRHQPGRADSISDDRVRVIYEDSFKNLWVGTQAHLNQLDRASGTFTRFISEPNDPSTLPYAWVASLYEDAGHVLWVGTWGGGAGKLDLFGARIPLYRAGACFSFLEETKNTLWIGGDQGLVRFDRQQGNLRRYRPSPGEGVGVHAIHQDEKGALWLGTFGKGLRKFDPDTEKFELHESSSSESGRINSDIVFAIEPDKNNILWIGTWGGGLNKFDRAAKWFTYYNSDPHDRESLSSSYVYTIHQDLADDNLLWIGTANGGLNKFDKKNETFLHYRREPENPESLSHDNVLAIHEDKAGTLWLGTYGGGLDKFDKSTGKAKHYTTKNGLPQNYVFGILEDEAGTLWLSTNKGIAKFDPKTEIFTNFDVNDGLQGSEFSQGAYHRGASGELYFGGVRGFNAFRPADMQLDAYVPPVVLTNFKIFNAEASLGTPVPKIQQIELSYKQSFFSLEFSSLAFAAPEKNLYSYKLDGLHDWTPPDDLRLATYTNLNPGDYVFHVKGSNRHQRWNEEGATVKIHVQPPPWRTWWAYAGYGVAFLALIAAFVRWQNARIERIKKEQRLVTVEKDLDVASTVQSWFLPASPKLLGDRLQLAGFFRPADRTSGDWWWYERLANQSLWVIVGDVTGHGTGPAVVTAAVATALRVQGGVEHDNNVAERLVAVNEAVHSICGGKYYMTTSSVEVDEASGHVRFYGTGGLPALCLKKEGKSSTVGARGTPLGVSSFEIGNIEYAMEPGERMMILTDGLAEAQLPSGKPLGMRRCREILESTRSMAIDEASRAIIAAVDRERGGVPQDDDFTFVLIDRGH